MDIFEKPNLSGDWKCPICKTNQSKQVTLIGRFGTENGNIIEAEQFHVDCLDLTYLNTYRDNIESKHLFMRWEC